MTTPSPDQRKKFATWKFEIEQAMMFDERLKASTFRIGVYILGCVNAENGSAYVTDETISELVPKCRSRTTVSQARKQLIETEWIKVRTGQSGRATTYWFYDANVNPILDVITDKRDQRDKRRKKRLIGGQRSPN